MKPNQWIPAAIVLVAVGLLIGGASLLRTFADEQPRADAPSLEIPSVPAGGPRTLPPPPLVFEITAPSDAVLAPAVESADRATECASAGRTCAADPVTP